jgi:hypothetical protein
MMKASDHYDRQPSLGVRIEHALEWMVSIDLANEALPERASSRYWINPAIARVELAEMFGADCVNALERRGFIKECHADHVGLTDAGNDKGRRIYFAGRKERRQWVM